MLLADKIQKYYLDNLDQLNPKQFFHLGSRLATWQGPPNGYLLLQKSTEFITQPNQSLTKTLQDIINVKKNWGKNSPLGQLRQPFFEKYPEFYGIYLALFRVRHLETIYQITAKPTFLKLVTKNDLKKLRQTIISDQMAIKTWSTFAINFFYLSNQILEQPTTNQEINLFYKIGQTYDQSDSLQIKLLLYLYTHCIIAQSNFYTETIPPDKLLLYQQMLTDLEKLISANYQKISLDNKLEFLVCAQICNFETNLQKIIYRECQTSLSPNGNFLIDTYNQSAGISSQKIGGSEHRNVLFIMSTSHYQPHPVLL